jgi:hypothetical protein
METPKPHPPATKLIPIQPTAKESTPSVKRPFVRKPHLTDRPLRDNAALEKMKNDLIKSKPARKPYKRNK